MSDEIKKNGFQDAYDKASTPSDANKPPAVRPVTGGASPEMSEAFANLKSPPQTKLHPPQWLGRPILHQDHVQDLETRAAVNEFHHKMPRHIAEQAAHESYVKEQRERAAAHHLAGMKASMATGNHEDARKHWALYDLHLKALGKDSIGAIPPEIEKRMMEAGDKPVYKFKAHKGDLYALHEPTKDVAPAAGQSIQKSEDLEKAQGTSTPNKIRKLTEARYEIKDSDKPCKSCGQTGHKIAVHPWNRDDKWIYHNDETKADACIHCVYRRDFMKKSEELEKAEARPCKWRLGERRCQRMVSSESGYCHSHVDHWANKIKQKEAAQPEMDKAELGHIHKPCPLCGEKQKNLSHHLDSAHEFEMEQRRKNPDDPVVQGMKKAETIETAKQLLKAVAELAKGKLLQFPGNKAPAVDQGAPAPVQKLPVAPPAAVARSKPAKQPEVQIHPHGAAAAPVGQHQPPKNHGHTWGSVIEHVGHVLGGECGARALDDEEDYEETRDALAHHFKVHPDVIHEELQNHTGRAMDDNEDLGYVTRHMANHLRNHFGLTKPKTPKK
jgi:hypothetical protein